MSGWFDPAKHHRRSIRLKGYDYTQPGAYFITLCTNQREALFGQVQDGVMHPSRLGEIVLHAWMDLPNHYPHVILDAFCLMPDHVHGIIGLVDDRAGPRSGTGGSDFSTTEIHSFKGPLKEIDCQGEQDHLKELDSSGTGGSDFSTTETNSFQGLLKEINSAGEKTRPKRHGLPEIVRAFKSFSARRINLIRRTPGISVWQRDYYEHIIRNEEEYRRISAYILANPSRWRGG